MDDLLPLVSVVATVASLFLLASPVLTVRAMVRAKSIGVMTITFFCAQFFNCVAWSTYGIQLLAPPVIICNVFGVIIAAYCILTFTTVARREEAMGGTLTSTTAAATSRAAFGTVFLSAIFLCFIIIMLGTVGPEVTAGVNGVICAGTTIIMLTSPLGAVPEIIHSQNAQALQPVTVICATANSILWMVYGVLTENPIIIATNAVCTLASLLQGFLLIIYGREPVDEAFIYDVIITADAMED